MLLLTKNMMRRLAAFSFYLSASCASPEASEVRTETAASQRIPGVGFDQGFYLEPCLTGTVDYGGNRSMRYEAVYDESAESLQKNLGIKVRGSLNVGLIGGGVEVAVATRNSRSSTRSAMVVSYDYIHGKSYLSNPQWLPGKAAGSAECGDHAITEITWGLRYYSSIIVHFKNEETRRKFEARLHISVLFGLIRGSVTVAKVIREEFADDLLIELDTWQTGGDQLAFANFKANLDRTPCSLNDIESCQQQFGKINDYLENNVREQIESISDDQYSRTLHPVGLKTRAYSELFSAVPEVAGVADVQQQQDESFAINQLYGEVSSRLVQAESWLQRTELFLYEEENRADLAKLYQEVKEYRSKLKPVLEQCPLDRELCEQGLNSAFTLSSPVPDLSSSWPIYSDDDS